MLSNDSKFILEQGKLLYESRYREEMEKLHPGGFFCIEPVSGRYWVGRTLDDAVNAAGEEMPDCLTYTLQIGRGAAVHLGMLQ